jgi:uracil-DNA glycosylase family 4
LKLKSRATAGSAAHSVTKTENATGVSFDAGCRACPRLAKFLDEVRSKYPVYYAKPVPPFGATRVSLLIVGLAPGMHGANRTGRPFTGDYAGILLYKTLHKFGFASQDGSDDPDDGLELLDCRITNAVKCLPPENKPEPAEVRECNRFLAHELQEVHPRVVLALGAVAHRAVLMALKQKLSAFPFVHGARYDVPADGGTLALFDSYHCSRYNTNTGRLTDAMFEAVFRDISAFLSR